jgi:hypothetical protein
LYSLLRYIQFSNPFTFHHASFFFLGHVVSSTTLTEWPSTPVSVDMSLSFDSTTCSGSTTNLSFALDWCFTIDSQNSVIVRSSQFSLNVFAFSDCSDAGSGAQKITTYSGDCVPLVNIDIGIRGLMLDSNDAMRTFIYSDTSCTSNVPTYFAFIPLGVCFPVTATNFIRISPDSVCSFLVLNAFV